MRNTLAILPLLFLSPGLSAQVILTSPPDAAGELSQGIGHIIRAAPVFTGSADGFTFFGGLPDDPLGMLQQKDIQEEVELSKAQVLIVKELQKDIQRQTREIFAAQAKLGGDATLMMESAQKAVQQNVSKELNEILSPKQLKRLGQLEVQMKLRNRGVRALIEEKLSKALEISEDQKKSIGEKAGEMAKNLQEEYRKLRERYRTELIKEILNDGQLTKLEDLSGKEFDVQPVNVRRLAR